jgi:putative membrane protein
VIEWLPHVNVSLNSLAILLLIVGFVLIKQKREAAHKKTMLATFAVSVVFLISYLTYHFNVPSKPFPVDPQVAPVAVRYAYYGLLLSHILLAATVPVLALWTIYLGIKGKREQHRKLAKWTWPIWLYVSVTGVIVYLMLYQIYVPLEVTS